MDDSGTYGWRRRFEVVTNGSDWMVAEWTTSGGTPAYKIIAQRLTRDDARKVADGMAAGDARRG